MTTNGVGSSSSNNSTSGSSTTKGYGLKTEDFINMMVTQLQNQDPLEPAKNEALLAQMSQIGQLESSTQLQSSLKLLVVQNQIGSAASLMGKTVTGLVNDQPVDGVVTSVKVTSDGVTLELDNGYALPLNNVSQIAPTPTAAN